MLLSALQITMREPTVAWRLLWQAPYSDVRHVAPHVKLMSDLIVGRWWRDGTRVPDGPDDFDAMFRMPWDERAPAGAAAVGWRRAARCRVGLQPRLLGVQLLGYRRLWPVPGARADGRNPTQQLARLQRELVRDGAALDHYRYTPAVPVRHEAHALDE